MYIESMSKELNDKTVTTTKPLEFKHMGARLSLTMEGGTFDNDELKGSWQYGMGGGIFFDVEFKDTEEKYRMVLSSQQLLDQFIEAVEIQREEWGLTNGD